MMRLWALCDGAGAGPRFCLWRVVAGRRAHDGGCQVLLYTHVACVSDTRDTRVPCERLDGHVCVPQRGHRRTGLAADVTMHRGFGCSVAVWCVRTCEVRRGDLGLVSGFFWFTNTSIQSILCDRVARRIRGTLPGGSVGRASFSAGWLPAVLSWESGAATAHPVPAYLVC